MKIAISFDDGLSEQYEWAKELYRRGIVGTFYINPMTIGHGSMLTIDQLKDMQDNMGHIIANHLWYHEAPLVGLSVSNAIGSLIKARNWLVCNGFNAGADLLSLPYGSLGGEWEQKYIAALMQYCKQIRDVSETGLNCIGAHSFVAAVESNEFTNWNIDSVMLLHYFHGHKNTTDEEFVSFLDSLNHYGVVFVSMLEIANKNI